MKFKNFSRTASIVGLAFTAALMTGCTKMPEEGNFLVTKYWWSNTYEPTISKEREVNILDTIYEIYGKEKLYSLLDQTPKDKSGVLIQDLDITIAIKVNPQISQGENIIKFIVNKGGLVYDETLKQYVLGESYILKDAGSVLSKVFAKIDSEELLNNKEAFEKTYSNALQEELNKLYGEDVFNVADIKVAGFKASQATEQKIQNINAIKAEENKNNELLNAAISKEKVMLSNAKMIKNVSNLTGLTVDQVLEAELIKAISESSDSAPKTVIDITNVKKPKM